MKQALLALIGIPCILFFSVSAQAADTYSFVTQTSNASTLSFLNASTGTQFSGRALGVGTNQGATYSADGSIAFVITPTKQGTDLDAYSVPAGKHVGTVNILGGVNLAAAIPGTTNLFVSDYLDSPTAIYEVDGTTFTAKPVFSFGNSRIRIGALAVSPDGGTLYISTGTALLSVSTTTFKQTASVLIAGIDRIAVTPDGSLLILGITSVLPNILAEYNPKTMAVIGSVPSDEAAYVAVSPDGSSFYTTLTSNGVTTVEQVSVATLAILNSLPVPSGVETTALERGTGRRRGLERDAGDPASPLSSWHARIDRRGTRDSDRSVQPRTRLVKAWHVVFTKQAQKDARRIAASGVEPKARQLLSLLAADPFRNPPPFEKLVGDLRGAFSRRINLRHRLVYQVIEDESTVKVPRMWTHYE